MSGDILATSLNASKMIMRSSARERSILILVRGKWTADMAKDLSRGQGERLEMLHYIRKQQLEGATMMIMRHGPPRDTPEPWECRLVSGS